MVDPLKQEYQRRKRSLRDPKLQLIFSALTGDIYTVEKDEIYTLENYQVPIRKYPNNRCKYCFGRGHVGKDVKTNYMIPCPKCIPKIIDFNLIKRIQEVRQKNIANTYTTSAPVSTTPVTVEPITNV